MRTIGRSRTEGFCGSDAAFTIILICSIRRGSQLARFAWLLCGVTLVTAVVIVSVRAQYYPPPRGYNAPPPGYAPPCPAVTLGPLRGAARGAAGGALFGAIGGNAGKGAAIGAAVGGVAGAARRGAARSAGACY